jgi:WD40 repeat protein
MGLMPRCIGFFLAVIIVTAVVSGQQPAGKDKEKDKKAPMQQPPGKDKEKEKDKDKKAPVQQPPGKDKEKDKDKDKKAPMPPPINPAAARLESTFDLPVGPAFDLAAGGEDGNELVAVAGERDAIAVFRKDSLKDPKTAKPEIWKGHQGPVLALAYNGGPILASAGADKKIIFWKAPEGKIMQTVTAPARVHCLTMSKDGKWVASAGEDGIVQLWATAGAQPGTKLADHKDWVQCLAFSLDGKQLASGSLDGTIRLWDVPAGKKLADLPFKAPPPAKTPPPDPIPVRSLAFAPDGKALLYGAADGPVHFISPGDGKTIRTLTGHTRPVTAIRFHPSGNLLATASKDRTVLLWNPAQPQPVKKLEGHTAWVEGLAFIDQGQRLASAGADRTLRIWDLTEPKKK